MSKEVIAIVYDFDGTLAPGYMQDDFLNSLSKRPKNFWKNVKREAKEKEADEIVVYMKNLINLAREKESRITRKRLSEWGKEIEYFNGVVEWFGELKDFMKVCKHTTLEHYIISSGNEEIINSSKIKKYFEKIYACKYLYDGDEAHSRPQWPALVVNFTTKTQYLFRINKGVLDITDNKGINKYVEPDKRRIPFRNLIFIGDGHTDIPCLRLVKEQGGLSIAVYKPNSNRKIAQQLKDSGRAHACFPADYTKEKSLWNAVTAYIELVDRRAAVERIIKNKLHP